MRTFGKEFYHYFFVKQSKVNSTTQYSSSQLAFGWNIILNFNQEANWQLIKQRKQVPLYKGDHKLNCGSQSHVHRTGEKVALKNAWKTKANQDTYICPYILTEVQNNTCL